MVCDYCLIAIEGDYVEEPHFENATDTGPWFYHPECWEKFQESKARWRQRMDDDSE